MRKVVHRIGIPTIIALVIALNGFVSLAGGFLSIAGGVALLRSIQEYGELPEYLKFAPLEHTGHFVSIFLGGFLLLLGKGLYDRKRAAWRLSLVVLVLLCFNNVRSAPTAPSSVLSLGLIGGLLVFRREFSQPSQIKIEYGQIVALGGVVFALAYGIIGAYLLRNEFSNLKDWTDAVYYTVVTCSTVGYGDITPLTDNAQIFTVSLVVIGLASFATAVTVVLGPMFENRIRGVVKMMGGFRNLTDHVVVCGATSVAESVMDELQRRDVRFVAVEEDEGDVARLRNMGRDVLAADACSRSALQDTNLQHARAIVAARNSDAENILIALTAREYRDEVSGSFRILVRVEDGENVQKAKRAGADEVVSPSAMGGRMLADEAAGGQEAAKK